MITGMWANSNLDDGKSTRADALKEIENSYDETLARIYEEKQEEIDFEKDPFFSAMKLPDDPGIVHDRTTTTEEIKVDQVD